MLNSNEHQLGEQQLIESDRRFRKIFDSQIQFIVIADSDCRIVEINDLPRALEQVSREQVLGQIFWETEWWRDLPGERSAWQNQFARALASNRPVQRESEFQTFAGEFRWADAAITAVRDAAGDLEYYIVQGSDTTELHRKERELLRSNRALKMLSRCNNACFRAVDEGQLLRDVCQIAVEEGGYKMVWVGFAHNDAAKSIIDMAHAGAENGYLAEIQLSWSEDVPGGQGPGGKCIRTGEAQLCPALEETSLGIETLSAVRAHGFRGVVCLPLRSEGHTFGLLGLYSSQIEQIGTQEPVLLQQLADNLAFGVGTLRAREEVRRDTLERRRHAQQMESLSAATLTANTRIREPDLFKSLADASRETLTCHQAVISLTRDADGAQAIHAVSLSDKYARWRPYNQQPCGSAGIGAFACKSRRSLRLTQAELEAHPHWEGFGAHATDHPPLRGWLAVPLIGSDGRCIGLLQLSDCVEGEFNEEDEAIATQFAHMLAVTIERSRLIERLHERDRFFQLSQEMFCIARPAGAFLQVNAAFSRVLGWSQEELTSRPFVEFVHPDDRAQTNTTRTQVLNGQHAIGFINRYRHQDGNYRWLEWNSAAAPEGNIYAVARDVTRRQEAERQLDLSLEELSMRNRELQDFAFIASHDLQEPLRKVRTFAERLVSGYAAKLEGPGLEYLQRMTNAVERMQNLIDALLDYSRVFSRPCAAVAVDLNAVLGGVLEDLEIRLAETGGRVTSRGLPSVVGDRIQLGQLFQNLISNALKFRAPGIAPRVEISAVASELGGAPAWTISVADNGIGFAEAFHERIFAPFQRLHGRNEYEGTGIGLAIARRIVERHGGNISAQGEPGAGAVFSVQLPHKGVRESEAPVS